MGSASGTDTLGVHSSPPALCGARKVSSPPKERQIQHRSNGQSNAETRSGCTDIPQGSCGSLCQFSMDEEGRTGRVSRQKPPVPLRSGGSVSLTDHNTASSFLFLFSVLLAKQHNVYTSGYYICQNNYGMTNGTSM